MVRIDILYEGDLRCRAEHAPSHTVLHTDAPVDNQGRGESFSPTDLVATALGTCMATVMGILARKHGWDIAGASVTVEKRMAASGARRIGALPTSVSVPAQRGAALDEAARRALEQTAHTCPVRLSIAAEISVPVTFDWGD